MKEVMDITASDWGPYSPELPGISHIKDGHKFTLAVLPGTMSGHHPIVNYQEANGNFEILAALPDLTYYKHRYFIGIDKKVSADVEYFTLSDEAAAVAVNYSNCGKRPANVETFVACQLENSEASPVISRGQNSILLDANDYSEIDSSHVGWVKDCRFGVYCDSDASNGTAIYWGTVYKGKNIKWQFPANLKGRYNISLRYCLNCAQRKVKVSGACEKELVLQNSFGKYIFSEPFIFDSTDEAHLTLMSNPIQPPLQIDCVILTPVDEKFPEIVPQSRKNIIENIKVDSSTSTSTMKSAASKKYYAIWSSNARSEASPVGPRRNYYAMTPDTSLPDAARLCNVANLLNGKLKTAGVMCIGNQNKIIKHGQSLEEIFIISTGRNAKFATDITLRQRPKVRRTINTIRKKYARHAEYFKGPAKVANFAKRLSAQTLTNINYPGILGANDEKMVRYYTPAKYYGTFYLWDMGMTGVGMAGVAQQQCKDLFNQYFPDDNGVPFVAWGTMLPCHIFLYWNHYQVNRNRKFLADNFESAMRMYDFFAGHDSRSAMRDPRTGLLSNFRYSYNSGGWDDYPAQQRYHQVGSDRIFPVVCTSQTIIAAKMLRLAAMELGLTQDADALSQDIKNFENLLYKHHWNEQEGHFSYYDSRRNIEKFLTIKGEDANKGLDGLFPLASGSLRQEHVEKFLEAITDESRFLTPYGLTTVDMTAGYYRPDGYWNGHVWVPPTWFFFRGLLNYGYVSEAKELAQRVINSFMEASNRQGAIAECVDNILGEAEHVPYFSGLTAPLLDLIDSLYGSRAVTTGPDIDATLTRQKDIWSLKIVSPSHRGKTGLLLTLGSNETYSLEIGDGKNKKLKADKFGKVSLCLDINQPVMDFKINKV